MRKFGLIVGNHDDHVTIIAICNAIPQEAGTAEPRLWL